MSDHEALVAIQHICERLSERRVALFLGSGINYGLKNANGESCPLGQGLSNLIARDVLEMQESGRPLDTISELAQYKVGPSGLNSYLYKLFKGFRPSSQHLSIVQLPWNIIYTTNYDTLIEDAALIPSITPAGRICPIVSQRGSTEEYHENDILYFKLHGCIELANTEHGRLILTKDDYRYYEKHRRSLFQRLREDASKHTIVFIGYGMEDPNFRAIIDDCRLEHVLKGDVGA